MVDAQDAIPFPETAECGPAAGTPKSPSHARGFVTVFLPVLLLLTTLLVASIADAGNRRSQCGGDGQRACCVDEEFPSCDPGIVEKDNCRDVLGDSTCQCGSFLGFPIYADGICVDTAPCGGDGERACCFGETDIVCGEGLIQVGDCEAELGRAACYCPGIGLSDGFCAEVECGGEGERACCVNEQVAADVDNCQSGLIEVEQVLGDDGCVGDCACQGLFAFGLESSGMCHRYTPCGGEGERACCLVEGDACDSGLTEVPGCSGDCFCGAGLLNKVNDGITGTSSGTCVRFESISEPEIGWAPPAAGQCGQPVCTGGSLDDQLCQGSASNFACNFVGGRCRSRSCSADSECGDGGVCELTQTCSVRGYADLHMHLFADQGHGGAVLAGRPSFDDLAGEDVNDALQACFATDHVTFDGDGVSQSLDNNTSQFGGCGVLGVGTFGQGSNCPDILNPDACSDASYKLHGCHGVFDEAIGSFIGTADGAKSSFGAPAFSDWPQWSSTTHQQAYYRWLERAWRGGLRLIVQHAVSVGALCKGGATKQYFDNAQTIPTDCDDSMASIDVQLQAAYDFENFIDRQFGGGVDTDSGWFRIVRTPAEARTEMAKGNMAVVLGIEVPDLFNCMFIAPGVIAACTPVDGLLEDAAACVAELTTSSDSVCDAAYVQSELDRYYDEWGVRHIFPIHNFDNAFGGAATWQDAIETGNRVTEGHWYSTRDCRNEGFLFRLGFIQQLMIALFKFDELVPEMVPLFESRTLSIDSGALDLAALVTDLINGDAEIPVSVVGPRADCNAFGLFPLGETLINAMMDKGMIIDVDHMSTRAFDDTIALAQAFGPNGYPLMASHVLFQELHKPKIRHERMRTPSQLAALDAMGSMLGVMVKDDVLDTSRRGGQWTLPYIQSGVLDTCRHSTTTFAQAYQYAVDKMGGRVGLGTDFNGVAGHFGPRFGSDACGGNEFERSIQLGAMNRLPYPFQIDAFGSLDRQISGQRAFDFNVHGLAHVGLLPDFLADMRRVGVSEANMEPMFRSAESYIQMWELARGETVRDQCSEANCSDTDVTPPALLCPIGPIVECQGPLTPINVPEPTAIETCSVATTTCDAPSLFPLGNTGVQCVSTDRAGNESSCAFDVTIRDTRRPNAICRNAIVPLDVSGQGFLSAFAINAGSTDLCSPVQLNVVRSAFGCEDIGVLTEALDVTDSSGNTRRCTSQIEVVDGISPVALCRSTIAYLDATGQASISPADVDAGSSDACGLSLSLSESAFSCADAGANAVTLSATDSSGNADACIAEATVVDALPPSITCPANISVTSAVGQCRLPVSYQVGVADNCSASVVCSHLSGTDFAVGDTAVTCTATDVAGNQSQCGFTVAVNDPPAISVSPTQQQVDYSDEITPIAISATDCGPDALSLTLSVPLPSTLSLVPGVPADACVSATGGGVACSWSIEGAMHESEGSISLSVSVDDGALYSGQPTVAIAVTAEQASLSFDGTNPVAVPVASDGGDSGPFRLSIDVRERLPDAADESALPGDIREAVLNVTLVPVGPGAPLGGTCSTVNAGSLGGFDYSEALNFSCAFDGVSVNTYIIEATLVANGNGEFFYTGDSEDVMVVFDPSLGFTTGGGWFEWPGSSDRTNFGYAMRYGKRGSKPKGSLLLIRHREDGGHYRIKSNALTGLALSSQSASPGWASFTGKSTYRHWDWLEPVGNHSFVVYVEDHDGLPGPDRFWIQVTDSAGAVVGTVSLDEPATLNAVDLNGGNIVVPHTSGAP